MSRRVVVAALGPDFAGRDTQRLANALRDAGDEVIYLGTNQTPEQIAEAVVQEEADAIAVGGPSSAHLLLVALISDALRDRGIDGVPIAIARTPLRSRG